MKKVITPDDPDFEEKWHRAYVNTRAYEMEKKHQELARLSYEQEKARRIIRGDYSEMPPYVSPETPEERETRIEQYKRISEYNVLNAASVREMNEYLETHSYKQWLRERRRRRKENPEAYERLKEAEKAAREAYKEQNQMQNNIRRRVTSNVTLTDEEKRQRRNEKQRKYYEAHKAEIQARNKERYKAKKRKENSNNV